MLLGIFNQFNNGWCPLKQDWRQSFRDSWKGAQALSVNDTSTEITSRAAYQDWNLGTRRPAPLNREKYYRFLFLANDYLLKAELKPLNRISFSFGNSFLISDTGPVLFDTRKLRLQDTPLPIWLIALLRTPFLAKFKSELLKWKRPSDYCCSESFIPRKHFRLTFAMTWVPGFWRGSVVALDERIRSQ